MSASISTLDEMAAAKPRSIVSLRLLIRVSVLWQLIGLYNTWSHVSDHPAVLGRYSYGYAAVLLLSLLIALVWLALLLLPRRAEALLRGLSPRLRYALLLLPLLGLVPMWFTGVEFNAQHYLSMSWFWFAALLIRSQTDQAVRLRRWFIGLGLGLLVVMIPIAITALTARPFSPDEALWASIGYSLFSHGGLYSYTNLAPAWIITPGFGWSVGGYGWALTHLAFSPFVGRLWNLIGFWLAFAGIGLVTARLYGRAAGWVSAGVAALGMYFITALDYRPSHQLEATVMLILLVLLQARFSRGRARGWHWLTGLLVGLSLQMHAAAIVYVFGFSLFYLLDAVWRLYRQRDVAALLPLCWYGLGALIGGGLFYLFNILPAGGVDVYLATLAGDRWGTERILRFLYVSSRFDVFLSLLAIGYLIWRRNASDRLFLALLLPVLLGMALLDSQGYREPYLALYAIPVGTMLVHGLRTEGIQPGHNRHSVWTVACLLLVAAGMWSSGFHSLGSGAADTPRGPAAALRGGAVG